MLEKYIDKLMPIIATVMWVGGMGYIVMNLYTCFNEDEVQEVIIPKTIDEKIDSVESDIRSKEWLKIGYEFKLDSIMAIYPLELEVHNKGIELGGTVDIYNSGGIVNLICGDLENAKKNLKRALSLAPNDQGWFVTSQLVVTLYQLGDVDEIKELIFEKIDYIDMPAHMVAIYAAIQIDDNNLDEAKKYLEVANKKGLTEDSIFRQFFKPKPAKEFIEKISPYFDIKKN